MNPEGKPVPHPGKFVVLVVPAKNQQTGATVAMVVGGFAANPQSTPGAYGNYIPAKFSMTKLVRSEGAAPTTVEETWDVSTEAGDSFRFATSYERGLGNSMHIEPTVYSAQKPDFFRVYKVDQVTDVVHIATDQSKRANKVEFKGSGPQLSKVFDGTEQLTTITSIPAYSRGIFLPD